MKNRILSAAIIIVCLFAGAAFAADTIKIGFNAPLTGFAASDGKSSSMGAKLAVSQINKAGGIMGKQLELIIYDDQASASQSMEANSSRVTSILLCSVSSCTSSSSSTVSLINSRIWEGAAM